MTLNLLFYKGTVVRVTNKGGKMGVIVGEPSVESPWLLISMGAFGVLRDPDEVTLVFEPGEWTDDLPCTSL